MLCLLTSQLCAWGFSCGYDCYPGICCNFLEVDADVLWMRPTLCDQLYAIADPNSPKSLNADSLPHGLQREIRPLERFAYRIAIARLYANRSRDLTGQYTAFHTKRSEEVAAPPQTVIWPTFGHPLELNLPLWDGSNRRKPGLEARACAFSRILFDSVELQAGMRARTLCQHLYWRAAAAIQIANIDHFFNLSYQGFSRFTRMGPGSIQASVKSSRKTWGVGPRLILEARYRLPHRFGFFVRMAGSLLAGKASAKLSQKTKLFAPGSEEPQSELFFNVHGYQRCHLFPATEGKAGFFWALASHDCFFFELELGLEWDSYINALVRPIFNDLGATSHVESYSFSMRGVFLSVRIMS